jgi:hypothetical protein
MGMRSRKIFERTARVFGLLEALGKACGYKEAPFEGMIEEMLSGRDHAQAIPELAR